jgi:adenylosuccinate lyase
MPLPERYAKEVKEITRIWTPEGYFKAQGKIWLARAEAAAELKGAPTSKQLKEIKNALSLNKKDIKYLIEAGGHETNNYLTLVQGRLDPETGNFIHDGLTSSDVLDTSAAMQHVESLDILLADQAILESVLLDHAVKYRHTLKIERSHGQHAVPITHGREVLGWLAEVRRGSSRLKRAKEVIAVGKLSGEVGTNVFITPEEEELALQKLGLRVDEAPTQVISRDRYAEVTSTLAINAGTLERIAINIRLSSIPEIGELHEPFSGTGSSSMPHKENPELDEREDGLVRVVRGANLAQQESMALWWGRDISHSSTERFTLPDAYGISDYMIRTMTKIMRGLRVNEEKMAENLNVTYGAIYANRLMNTLKDTGQFSRKEAYVLVQSLAQTALREKIPLQVLAAEDERVSAKIPPDQLKDLFDPNFYLRNIDTAYKRMGVKID